MYQFIFSRFDDQRWTSGSSFEESWINDMETYQSQLFDLDLVKKNKDWFEYIPNQESMFDSHFRCSVCHDYSKEFPGMFQYQLILLKKYFKQFSSIKGTNNMGPLSKQKGMLKPTKLLNDRIIKKHRKSTTHTIAVEEFKRVKKLKLDSEVDELIEDPYPWTITARHMRYEALDLNIPYTGKTIFRMVKVFLIDKICRLRFWPWPCFKCQDYKKHLISFQNCLCKPKNVFTI